VLKQKKMSRSKWKGSFIAKFLLKKNYIFREKNKIWARNSIIPFFLLNKSVVVYNGKFFKKLFITREKIGYKFGEFIFTNFQKNGQNYQKKKKKNNK